MASVVARRLIRKEEVDIERAKETTNVLFYCISGVKNFPHHCVSFYVLNKCGENTAEQLRLNKIARVSLHNTEPLYK